MRALGIVVLTIVVIFILAGVFAVLYIKSTGLSAKAHPGRLETSIAGRALELSYPAGVKDMRNPAPATPETLSAARDHFARDCAVCHANDGSGKTEIGSGLYPPPPDLRDESDMTDGELFHIIRNGIRFTGMPGWSFSDEKVWRLVGFIRALPKLSQADLEAMDAINHLGAERHAPAHE